MTTEQNSLAKRYRRSIIALVITIVASIGASIAVVLEGADSYAPLMVSLSTLAVTFENYRRVAHEFRAASDSMNGG